MIWASVFRQPARWAFAVRALLLCASPAAWGQSTHWPVPGEVVSVDLTAKSRNRHLSFSEEGLAYEAVVEFLLIGHAQVLLDVALPEAGRLEVRLTSPQAQCEVHNVAILEGRGRAEVVSLVPPMSRNAARERARGCVEAVIRQVEQPFAKQAESMPDAQLAAFLREQGIEPPKRHNLDEQRQALIAAYARAKAAPTLVQELRRQCLELAESRSKWVDGETIAGWEKAARGELVNALCKLIQMQLMAEYLTRHGIAYKDSEKLIEETGPVVDAVAEITSGQIGTDTAKWRRVRGTLGPAGMESVRRAVSVRLSVRLYPHVDPRDANSQWFLGQCVAARARDVSAVRVEGALDPAKNDLLDCWILERYDAAEVVFEPAQGAGFKIEPLFQTPRGTLLRVRTTGSGAVSYWFELRPKNKRGNVKVVIHESPNDDQGEFPF